MELPELQQGLQNIQQAQLPPDAAPATEAPWLNMGNLMQGYGNWFDNDKGLGEVLLGQLRARGVDTQAATEAMLRELLQGLVDDLNTLQQKLTGFNAAITQQMQQTQAVADSVQAAINTQQPSPTALQMQPPTGAEMPQMNDIPSNMGLDFGEQPEGDAGEVPPEGDTGEASPESAAGEAPPESAAGEVPPENASGGDAGEVPPEGTTSDARVKKIHPKLSPVQKQRFRMQHNTTKIKPSILSACSGGF